MQLFGDRLFDGNLWHLNRHSVSRGLAIGLFCAYLPMPFEMIPAALLSLLLRGNLPIAILGVWTSNPFTWVPIYFPGYWLGSVLLGTAPLSLDALSMDVLAHQLAALWLGCILVGSALAALAYGLTHLAWRIHILLHLRSRRQRIVK